MNRKKTSLALLVLISSSHLTAAPMVDLQLSSQDSIHRVRVPSSLLVECQSAGLANVHVIDGSGKNMSMARITAQTATSVVNGKTAITAVYPLWDRQALPDRSSLRVIEQQGRRSIEWNNTAFSSEAPQRKQRGVLLDSRVFSADEQAVQLILKADMPDSEMIPLQIDISKDLNRWQTIQTDAFLGTWRSEDGSVINKMNIDLPQLALHEHFVRLRWSESLAGEIVIHSADIISEQQQSTAPQQEHIELGAPESKSNQGKQGLVWQFNPPLALDALQLRTQAFGTHLAVQLQGRVNPEAPWRTLNRGTIMHLQHDGKIHTNQPFAISGGRWQALQVILDDNNAVWPSDIRATALVPVQQIAFMAQGHAPYRLTCMSAEYTGLHMAQLIPNYQRGDEYKLPEASVILDESVTIAPLQTQPDSPPYVLWGILGAGIVLLTGMLGVIIRQLKTATTDGDQ